jgi:hypothetical protein
MEMKNTLQWGNLDFAIFIYTANALEVCQGAFLAFQNRTLAVSNGLNEQFTSCLGRSCFPYLLDACSSHKEPP